MTYVTFIESLPVLLHSHNKDMKKRDNKSNLSIREKVTDFDELYISMCKCRKGVTWKPSVKSFVLNSEERLYDMEKQLKDGSWKNGKVKEVAIHYPKKRKALSIPFRDRVYQRSINDNALYPQMTESFIYANTACQKGKGTDFARKLVKKYLRKHVSRYGTSGWIIQIDIHQYYQSMPHHFVNECFMRHTDEETYEMSTKILNNQYVGETGYKPGSQMVQIAGISLLNDIDHYIKENLHILCYIRYQDDLWILTHDKNTAYKWFRLIERKINSLGFELNPKKSHVSPLSKGFLFLGFFYRITKTGKIIMSINSDNVKHERKKLKRMVHKSIKQEIQPSKIDECYSGWKNNASKGNSYELLKRMDNYLLNLRKEDSAHVL